MAEATSAGADDAGANDVLAILDRATDRAAAVGGLAEFNLRATGYRPSSGELWPIALGVDRVGSDHILAWADRFCRGCSSNEVSITYKRKFLFSSTLDSTTYELYDAKSLILQKLLVCLGFSCRSDSRKKRDP